MRPEHTFGSWNEFELSVFDAACREGSFHTLQIKGGPNSRVRAEFGSDLAAALAAAQAQPRTAAYALAPSGRHIVLELKKREFWLERQQGIARSQSPA